MFYEYSYKDYPGLYEKGFKKIRIFRRFFFEIIIEGQLQTTMKGKI